MSSPLEAWKLLTTNSLQSAEVIFTLLGLTQGVVIPKKTMKHRHFPVMIFSYTRWFWSQSLESLDFEDLYSIRKMCIHLLEMKSVKAFFEHSSGFLWFFVGKYITRYLHHLQLQVTSSLILAKFGQLTSPFRAWYSLEGKSTPGRRLTFINNSYYFTYKGRCF